MANKKGIEDVVYFDADKVSKKLTKVAGVIFILFIVVFGGFALFAYKNMQPIDKKDDNTIEFVVGDGWGSSKVLDELYKAKLIKEPTIAKIFLKISPVQGMKKGTYQLSKSMGVFDMLEMIEKGDSLGEKGKMVQFIEGKRFPYYANKIAEEFGFTQEEVINKAKDKEFLNKLIEKYWFIDESILNDKLYYPLEGYVFADTYSFKADSTIEEILTRMIDGLDAKVTPYKNEIEVSKYSFHDLLTLASVVELEAVTADDRKEVAGVFINRLNAGDSLGSDVTTYYGVRKDITESLYNREINECNDYNTRGQCNKGVLPVGPIASPRLDSIVAAIEPNQTKNYYFVADTSNKLYFAETEAGHQANIAELKRKGIWPE